MLLLKLSKIVFLLICVIAAMFYVTGNIRAINTASAKSAGCRNSGQETIGEDIVDQHHQLCNSRGRSGPDLRIQNILLTHDGNAIMMTVLNTASLNLLLPNVASGVAETDQESSNRLIKRAQSPLRNEL